RGEIGLAVAAQLFDVGERLALEAPRVALAAVEEGQVVARGARGGDEVRSEEAGAAQHQDPHRRTGLRGFEARATGEAARAGGKGQGDGAGKAGLQQLTS